MFILDKCTQFINSVLKHSWLTVGLSVLFVPLLYGYCYLRSYWDSYQLRGNLPFAVVNLDSGNGEVNFGEELVDYLKELDLVKLFEVSTTTALDGIKDRSYYAYLSIPENYTKSVSLYPVNPSSSTENHPTAILTYVPNQKTSYPAYQILQQLTSPLLKHANSVARNYLFQSLTTTLLQVPAVYNSLLNGALAQSSVTNSLNLISALAEQLSSSSSTEDSSKLEQFTNGLSTYVTTFEANVPSILQNAATAFATINSQAGNMFNTLLETIQATSATAQGLISTTDGVTPGTKLSATVQQVYSLTSFAALASNTSPTSELTYGSTYLSVSMEKFAEQIQSAAETASVLDGLPEFAAEPVEVVSQPYGEIYSFGQFFTPMIMTLCLYVTPYMIYIIYHYDQWHRFPHFDRKNVSLKQDVMFIPLFFASNFITIFMFDHLFRINPSNVPLFYLGGLWSGLCLALYVQFLNRVFGDFGKVVSVVILILQVGASNGTLPFQVTKPFFRAMYYILPPSYSVNLIREAMRETNAKLSTRYIFALFGFGIGSLLLTICYEVIVILYARYNTEATSKNAEEEGQEEIEPEEGTGTTDQNNDKNVNMEVISEEPQDNEKPAEAQPSESVASPAVTTVEAPVADADKEKEPEQEQESTSSPQPPSEDSLEEKQKTQSPPPADPNETTEEPPI